MGDKKKPALADEAHVSEHAKPHTAAAIAVLVEVMNSKTGTKHDSTRIRSADLVLKWAWTPKFSLAESSEKQMDMFGMTDAELAAIAARGR